MNLDRLLRPRSIAILGASERGIGRAIMESLGTLGFTGEIFPVNPKYEHVLDRRCYPSLRDLPAPPDVVAFCVSTGRALDGLRMTAEAGGRAAVIYDGGFAERGEDGRKLQSDIAAICREANIALCGPNCMGVLSAHDRSTTYMQEVRAMAGLAGDVGLISQSGSICIGMLADVRRYGFSHVISSGNEAVVPCAEYLEFLAEDPETKVIAAFLESVREPDRFVAALDRAADHGKPVAVLKVGRTERTRHAITSHTGGLAGESRVFSEVLRAHRAIEVDDLDELAEVLAAATGLRKPAGSRIGVVTASGGQAELILDAATEAGLDLPPLDSTIRADAEKVIGPLTGDGNPLDAWGNGDFATNFPKALASLDASPSCDAVVLCTDAADGNPMGRADRAMSYARVLADAADRSRKPHYMLGMRAGLLQREPVEFLRGHGVPVLGGARQGLAAIARLGKARPRPPRAAAAPAGPRLADTLRDVHRRPSIHEADAKRFFGAHGLPVTRETLVHDVGAAVRAAAEIGWPVAIKVVSDQIAHKSEHGLVALAIKDDAALRDAYERLMRAAAKTVPSASIAGILVQEMVSGGIETFVGVSHDPDFGPVIAAGVGGVGIEIFRDYALRLLPLAAGDAAAMIAELKAYPLLQGARCVQPYDVPALVALVESVGAIAWAERENVHEIDLNPVKLFPSGEGCRIVDALIVPTAT
jgi:acyl-CoA synthetase (NDP forming)